MDHTRPDSDSALRVEREREEERKRERELRFFRAKSDVPQIHCRNHYCHTHNVRDIMRDAACKNAMRVTLQSLSYSTDLRKRALTMDLSGKRKESYSRS